MTSARPARRLGAVVLLVALALPGAPALGSASAASRTTGVLDPGLPVTGQALLPVVVTGTSVRASVAAVRAAGVRPGRELPLVDGVAARVPADRLAALAARPGVAAVTRDRTGQVHGASYDTGTSASPFAWSTGTAPLWGRSDGEGVAVAVLDTGVAPVPDLADRLVSGPDLSGEGDPRSDGYGHGTVMAGLVAGSGAASGSTPRTGTAPGARVVSVKVAGANGAADVSTVLAAMHWVAAYREQYGIRVLSLSWGVPSTQDPAVDPLDHAVERLWGLGITVVVAAGNAGPGPKTVTKPADDPLVLTVGAYDDKGDTNTANDAAVAWSSRGPTAQGVQKPDVVAPGRSLVATRSPGSVVESENPKALVGSSYIRGSGTSQATAVVAGAAAVLLGARPGLTPDQVKAALVRTASPLPAVDRTVQGAGRVQVERAARADVRDITPAAPVSTGLGSLDASRGSAGRVQVSCGGTVRTLDDETTSWCAPWDGQSWTGQSWTGQSWTGQSWTGQSWTGQSWTGQSWTGQSWTGQSWTGQSWTGQSWTGQSWSSAAYEPEPALLTSFWGAQPDWWRHVPGERSDPAPAACRPRGDCA